ncbi:MULTISPECIES: dicarboxylate/amino acid:cation symporter [Novosphingobium]|uniref:C4-dicarboxylate ABC transporter n=1 Tax=Novosphingobium lindaniclasticum LE124 TaxID=1096930 RepID=T0ITA7_9SPHN|nr:MULTISPECIES: cation:dicarboxylase symporter family transporter [Novosphingobium]EQB15085.1 C4-dicarboxylate ABC transporter [Novosphingobium lindaniclasticum LE124]
MGRRLTLHILAGMILGIAAGYVLHASIPAGDPHLKEWAGYFRSLPDVFLRLIKMILAPLVFATIVTGIAGMGDSAALGRIGGKALAWFITASLCSLGLGLVLVNLFQPGVGVGLDTTETLGDLQTGELTLHHFILEIFPASPLAAMAENNILQILVFSVFVGVGLTAIGEKSAPIVRVTEALSELMLQITGYVMRFAPFAVFGAIAAVIGTQGLGIIVTYGVLVSEFYFAMFLLWVLLFCAGGLFLGKRVVTLFRYIREPLLLSFSTASSEASLPKLFEQLDRFGVPRRISGFILPLGYSFNLDGSMIYMTFASMFIAQAYGIHVPLMTQILMLLTLMVSSKGIAGVPRASLVVIAATLTQFGLPVEGIALLLGVDTFLDMGRSATNVVGNAVATAVITRSEGMLQPLMGPDADVPSASLHQYADQQTTVRI